LFLGRFAKLRKAIFSFAMSYPSAWNNSSRTGIFLWNLIFSLIRKVLLEPDKNNWYCTWRPVHIYMTISRSVLLRMRNVSDKSFREIQNTHFTFNKCFPKILLLWDKVENYGRAGWATSQCNTAQTLCMLDINAYRHTRTHTHTHTHTLKKCNNYCFSTPTTVTRTRLNITFIPTLPVVSQVMRLKMSRFLSPLLHMPSCRAERQQPFISILQPNNVIGFQISAWLLSCIQFGGKSLTLYMLLVAISWPQCVFTNQTHKLSKETRSLCSIKQLYFLC
jgi:hypothetical protein